MTSQQKRPETAIESVAAGGWGALVAALVNAHPDLAAALAGVGAGLQTWFPRLFDNIWERRRRNVVLAVASGVDSAGVSVDDVIEAAGETPSREVLSGDVIEACVRTAYEEKVIALGRAWAAAVLTKDEAEFEREAQFVRTVTRLELPHIRVLRVAVGDYQQAPVLRAGVAGWTPDAIRSQLPGYGPLVDQLIAVLASEGLIVDQEIPNPMIPVAQFNITVAGNEVLRRIEEAGQAGGSDGSPAG